jgi:hypothetical protein
VVERLRVLFGAQDVGVIHRESCYLACANSGPSSPRLRRAFFASFHISMACHS